MSNEKLAGIYRIKNKLNGKSYIGQSKDLYNRFKHYYWAVTTEAQYYESLRDIITEIRKVGIDNFEFTIIASGKEYKDKEFRLLEEMRFINLYDAFNPDHGYNLSEGGESGPTKPRKQSDREKFSRSKSILVYDIYDQRCYVYLAGAKSFGDEIGYARTIITRNIKRGSIILDRYYVFYYKREDRDYIYNNIKSNKKDKQITSTDRRAATGHNKSVSAFESYKKVLDIVNYLF